MKSQTASELSVALKKRTGGTVTEESSSELEDGLLGTQASGDKLEEDAESEVSYSCQHSNGIKRWATGFWVTQKLFLTSTKEDQKCLELALDLLI